MVGGQKYYVYAMSPYYPGAEKGKDLVAFMRLDHELAVLKAGLASRLELLKEHFPRSPEEQEMMPQLHKRYHAITGPLERCIVAEGKYQLGQILDKLPDDAIQLKKQVNKTKED